MRAQNDPNRTTLHTGGSGRRHRSRGHRLAFRAVAAVGAWVLALTGAAQAAYADPLAADPDDVAKLRAGIAAFAEVALGDYEDVGPLAAALPLTDTAPGATVVDPGASMQLAGTFAAGIKTALLALDPVATTADLMAAVDGLDADVAGTQLDISTANLVDSGETRGFDLTIRASRTVESPLAVVDPDGPGGEPLRLVTAEADPAPYDLAFEFSGIVRTDPQGERFWLDTTHGEPEVGFTAELAGDAEFAFPGGAGAVGVGDVEILDGSTVDVAAEWSGTIDDVNGDGRLAMFEPPAFAGGEETPGELTIPADQLTSFDLAGTATADIEFGSSLLGLDTIDPPSLALDADLATDPDLLAALTASDGDLAAFEAFTRLGPADLVSGLVQYGTLLRALQRHPSVNAELPLLSGTLADLYDLGGEFAALAESLITVTPPAGGDPTDPVDPVIEIGITTVGDLADAIEGGITGADAEITPVYDRDDASVELDFTISTELDGVAETVLPPLDPNLPVPPAPAQLAFGDQLLDQAGLRAATAGAEQAPETDVAADIDLPIVIDLSEASSEGSSGEDDPSTAVVEFEDPMVYERFETELVDGAEVRLIQEVDVDLVGSGQIGFVPAAITGGYELSQDGGSTTTEADVDAASGGDSSPRLTDLLAGLYAQDGQPASYPVAEATRHAEVTAALEVHGHGADAAQHFTEDSGTVSVSGTGFDPSTYTAGGTNDEMALLRSLDVDTSAPSRLLGRALDGLGSVVDAVDSVDSALGGGATVPFLNRGIERLLQDVTGLKDAYDDFRGGELPVDLADFETELEAALGLEVGFRLRDLDDGSDLDPVLVIDLDGQKTDAIDVPLSLADASIPAIAGTSGAGELHAALEASLDLGVVIGLEPGSDPVEPRLLDSSRLSVTAEVTESSPGATELAVHLGPFSAQLGDAANQTGRIAVGVEFALGRSDGPEPGDPTEAPMPVADYFSGTFDFTAGSAQDGGYACAAPGQAPVTGTFGCAALPVLYDPGSGLQTLSGAPRATPSADDYLTVAIDDLTAAPDVTAPAALDSVLSGLDFSFDSLTDGLKSIGLLLDLAITASQAGGRLPVVGDDLTALADGLADVKAFLDDPQIPGMPTANVDEAVYGPNGIRQVLADKLVAAGVLRDGDYGAVGGWPVEAAGDTTPGATDIRVVAVCDDGAGGEVVCPSGASLADLLDLRIELELGQGARTISGDGCPDATACPGTAEIPLDLGLPGLPLSLTGTVTAQAGWTVELGFGISRDDGFYLLDNPVPGTGAADPENADGPQEVRVNLGAHLAAATPIAGRIGFIGMEATDNEPGGQASGASLTAQLGLVASACDALAGPYDDGVVDAAQHCTGIIPIASFISGEVGDFLTEPSITGGIHLDLAIDTGISSGETYSTVNKTLPSFTADFVLDWSFDGDTSSDPTLELNDIGVKAGELFTKMFGEVIDTINPIIEPIEPIREFLFSPIPVISDLSEFFDGPPVTMVDLAEMTGLVDVSLLKDINQVFEFLELAKTLANGESITLIESLSLSPDTARDGAPPTPDEVEELYDEDAVESEASSPAKKSAFASKVKDPLADDGKDDEFDALGSSTGSGDASDFSYPVFDDPSCLVGLLLGKDCAIVEWRPDPLTVHMEYTMSFGPFFGVLYVTIGGALDAKAEIGAGVSTRGIRMLGEQLIGGDGITLDAESIATPFLQSLYLTDLDAEGKDLAEFEVSGTITAGAKLDIFIAEAGVRGGITATFGLNLNDTPEADGRMHIDEIIEKFPTPICLFDIEGKLVAFLEVFAEFGVCPFCYSDSWRLAEITLFEFSSSCADNEPVLAEELGGWVVLNVGPKAGDRTAFTDVENESFTVRQMAAEPDGDGEYPFIVTAFGYSQPYEGVGVKLDAGTGNDSFLFSGSGEGAQAGEDPESESNVDGETPPDDPNRWPFTAPVGEAKLGTGNDSIVTGSGDDVVVGGPDDDTITLGDGSNTASGDESDGSGEGLDQITGGDGTDTLRGGGKNDVIDGGLGGDTIRGDAGNDTLRGGKDKLKVPPGAPLPEGVSNELDGIDTIIGGAGNDTVLGGSGDDRLYGDQEIAEDVNDESPAAQPGDGNDRVEGEGGADRIYGGGLDDLLFGGFRLVASGVDDSADRIQGGDGADQLFGSNGADLLYGGRGADTINGEAGADEVHGQSDADPAVNGGPDGDRLWGGPGADTVNGEDGDDELVGDGDGATDATMGGDTADGGNGDDIVLGDNGTVDGGPGARVAHPSETVGVGDPSLGGGAGADRVYGEGGADNAYGGSGADLVHGNGGADHLYGETGDDEVWGDGGDDFGYGGPGGDVVFGNAGSDQLHGQEGGDLIVGGHYGLSGADVGDTMYGGPDDDRAFGDDVDIDGGANGVLDALDDVSITPSGDPNTYGPDLGDGGTGSDEFHGQDAADRLYGAEDYDQLFGELSGDRLIGGAGPDDLVGDQGTIAPPARLVAPPSGGWQPGSPNGSPETDLALVAPTVGGDDLIWGDFDTDGAPWTTGGDDRGFGGHGIDTLRGGAFDDHLEGNGGQDRIFGFDEDSDHSSDGADDLIGGSSPVNPLADPEGADNALDEGEVEMQGNGEDDVMTGDNAVLTRVADPDDADAWETDPVTGGVFREVTLLDTEKTGASLDAVSGGDFMLGNDENDRMFGEGGNDLVQGNAHDDLVEGDQDGDWLEGNGDEDDLVGGSSFPDQPDGGDVLWGGGGADVLAGDNACIVRDVPGIEFAPSSCPALDDPAPEEFHYVTSQLGVETRRGLVSHDLDGPFPSEFGRDTLNGGSGVDAEFGQDGGDALFGDGGADVQHGNGAADIVVGDRPIDAYGEIVLPIEVGGALPALPAVPAGLPGAPSVGAALVGAPQADGQDDQFGGSNLAGHRDAGDWLFGDGEADFQLGDNGELNRTVEGGGDDAAYAVDEERYPDNDPPDDGSAVIEREVTRYDVGAPAAAGVWGADLIFGGNGTNPLISAGAGDGDDSQWGQDGNDRLFGEDGADDQFGELGDDTMWGGAGEDAMVGDRGGVQTRFVESDGSDAGDPDILTHTSQGPPGINLGGPDSGAQDAVLHPFEAHPLYRGTSLTHDRDGSVLVMNGHEAGGADRMRGGPGHDSMHGGEGADLMNGDSGGDYAYGDDGADVMWGGRGNPVVGAPDLPGRNAPGADGQWIDVLFAGYGASATEAGADIVDYQPRSGVDPASWFTMVQAYADTAPEGAGTPGRTETRQHHHGTDWQYGGWDRDVLQADVSANGPNDGDKLLDWGGAYNLYTACNSAYGGWNDVRKIDPNNLAGLEKLAYVTGARAEFDGAPTLGDVQANGSAFREVAIVYTKDLKNNTGKAFSGTPGHFENFICASD
ncbi:calcium-binding protein [Agromyces sp. NPDC057679]|uniref:calcium-binding protein n=1 Tax=Agromyces sp. NPDC057679 TaxID=3346207 RepID=UPI00366B9B46